MNYSLACDTHFVSTACGSLTPGIHYSVASWRVAGTRPFVSTQVGGFRRPSITSAISAASIFLPIVGPVVTDTFPWLDDAGPFAALICIKLSRAQSFDAATVAAPTHRNPTMLCANVECVSPDHIDNEWNPSDASWRDGIVDPRRKTPRGALLLGGGALSVTLHHQISAGIARRGDHNIFSCFYLFDLLDCSKSFQ